MGSGFRGEGLKLAARPISNKTPPAHADRRLVCGRDVPCGGSAVESTPGKATEGEG